ncbi:NUDIX hydrolase [Desulfosarcina cetonica]|uniref:NUDIX hydrolase n=1 Tax=Desulfosarcina cetonica TaxID=90730 RepID=UPI0006D2BAB4|nr:CoA pyrophosphatase [Desulfosarcina cetonica]VTR70936.1 NUDIX hydrolase [Desulfosarcina cetonica]
MLDLTFNENLLRHVSANLEQFNRKPFDRKSHAGSELKQAAVAVTLVALQGAPDTSGILTDDGVRGDAAMILTRRSARLRKHAGQWALPGGQMEAGERPEDTVLRELEEEVGLALDADRIIGRLDDYDTRSGFTIKPVVVWGGSDFSLTANPDEVASIHLIPLAEFMRADAPILETIPESDNPVLLMPVGETCIAAPTAAIIYQFREVAMLGKNRRVAHFEQPYFAWH